MITGSVALVPGSIPLFGTQEMGKMMNTLDQQYYLVNEEGRQHFVLLSDEFMIARAMAHRIDAKEFIIDDKRFLRAGTVE